MDRRPIGIFDSGLGGLTVLKDLMELFPKESFIYFGDTARVPYGNKSPQVITRFSEEIVSFLLEKNVKLILIACYTSTSLALEYLQASFPQIPILGVIKDGARAAINKTKTGKIGIIGTKATIKSRAFEKEIGKVRTDLQLFSKPCPLFVPLIEEGFVKGKFIREMIHYYLDELQEKGIDTLLLGCTHYPLIKSEIEAIYQNSFEVIDCGMETALFLKKFLKEKGLKVEKSLKKGSLEIYVSDDPQGFRENASLFLGRDIFRVKMIKTWEKGEKEANE
jgi:glutamate racemase